MNTIRDWIHYHAEHHPAQIFLLQPDGISLSYGELKQHCDRLAAQLDDLGLEAGAKVAFLLDNGAATALLFLGVMAAGRVIVPLNAAASPAQLAYTLEHSDAKLVLFSKAYQARLAQTPTGSLRVAGSDLPFSLLDDAQTSRPDGTRENDARQNIVISPDSPALLIYTSGTTGVPKGVLLSHKNVLAGGQNTVIAHQLSAQDRALCVLPLYHINGEIVTVIAPLISGGSVVMPTGFAVDTFWCWIHAYECTWFSVVPTLINHLLAAPSTAIKANKLLRFGRSASAPLSPAVQQAFEQRFGIKIIETMGLTECAAQILSNPLERNKYGSPGIAYGNQAKIVSPGGETLPPGEVGEILIRGDNVMQGYYKNPAATLEALSPDGWLHTGDLAYQDEDGFFFISGRLKELIIRGGENIAPREIDDVLYQHPAVLEAAAFGVEHELYGQEVAAAVVLKPDAQIDKIDKIDEEALLSFCEARLGSVKAPKWIEIREALPKGATGKIQRLACSRLGAAYEPRKLPRRGACSVLEQRLLPHWQAMLNQPDFDSQAHFFRCGGDSVRAAMLVNRLNAELDLALHPVHIFDYPTVATLAAWLENQTTRQDDMPRLPRQDGDNAFPLSFAQQRLWFLLQLEPAAEAAYQVAFSLELRGKIDADALQAAWQHIVERHESLRTRFEMRDGEAVQIVSPAAAMPANAAHEALWRFELEACEEARWRLHISLHHLISDGWSIGLIIQALFSPAETRAPAVQYADYAGWQKSRLKPEHLDYWREKLANAPETLDLPADYPRPARQSYHGATQDIAISPQLSAKLKNFVRQHDVTLFTLLFSAFAVLLHRYSGQDDIVIGTPVANRHHVEVEKLIGFFVNNLPLRVQFAAMRFNELLAQVQLTLQEALRHQDTPFEHIVEAVSSQRDLSHSPLFQSFFILHNAMPDSIEMTDFSVKLLPRRSHSAKFDLTLALEPRLAQAGDMTLRGYFEYSTALFTPARMQRMAGHFLHLLEAALDAPETSLSRLPLVTPEEIRQYGEWNQACEMIAPMITLPQWFQAQALRSPDAPAVVIPTLDGKGEAETMRYGALNQRANQIAQYLRAQNIQHGDVVAIYLPRQADLIVALLATWKCGACYLPLDPVYPPDRIAFMLADSEARAVITHSDLRTDLAADTDIVICEIDNSPLHEYSIENPPPLAQTEMPAYVIYTSGSTGTPKGVLIPHRAVTNFLLSMQATLQLTVDDVWLAVTSITFDIAALEIFLPLINGATVLLASRETAMDGRLLRELMHKATIMQATPATWRMVLSDAGGETQSRILNKLLCGGEAMSADLAAQLTTLAARAWNVYGPTETTIWSTLYEITPRQEADAKCVVAIGKPIGNTQVYVLDSYQQPVPVGVPGELYIGGKGLALGYLHRPELTAERFVQFGSERLYRTGDSVYWREDGQLAYLGRLDFQVKLRGFRIELGEIEAALMTHPAIQHAVVVAREERLIAYFTPALRDAESGNERANELKAVLRQKLPDYMIPSFFIEVNAFPLTPNNKIDRQALPAPTIAPVANPPAQTETERQLADIWGDLLATTPGREDDFFSLGGHSLLALQLMQRIEQQFGQKLPLRVLFEQPTLTGLASILDTESAPRRD
jgi:amino acid adenylation domain-containing protein